MIAKIATGEIDDAPLDSGKDPAATALGKKGALRQAPGRAFVGWRALRHPARRDSWRDEAHRRRGPLIMAKQTGHEVGARRLGLEGSLDFEHMLTYS
jgi:hypothetical protein